MWKFSVFFKHIPIGSHKKKIDNFWVDPLGNQGGKYIYFRSKQID